jgi:hypothetical protein
MILCITGMGRSGTSLIASLMQKAGVHLGRRFVAPDQANPRGFFEDADFYEFHDQMLRERGYTLLVPPDFTFQARPDEIERARRLIAERADLAPWGWKDPRTSLFLDFWQELLPDACFLFLYRHPVEVVLSLIRCRSVQAVGLVEALDAWCVYNSKIHQFWQQHRSRCLLCHPYRIVEDPEGFHQLVEQKLRLPLEKDAEALAGLYHPGELRRVPLPAEVQQALYSLHPESARLYDQFQATADWPASPVAQAGPLPTDQRVYTTFLNELSQPIDSTNRRPLLFLLFSRLEPETLETSAREHGRYLADLERAKAWLEEQRASWQRTAEQAEDRLEQQRQWLAELEKARNWLAADRERWQKTAEEQLGHIEEQQTWLAKLEQARDWLADQRFQWEETAKDLLAQLREKEKPVPVSDGGQAWLEKQRAWWEQATSASPDEKVTGSPR